MNRKFTVLVIDDEERVQESCDKMLSLHGFDIFKAKTGAQATDILRKEDIDVILLDVILPDCSGLDLLISLKAEYPDIEVIIMTAYGSIDLAIKALKNGAYDFLTKPFSDLEALPHAVKKACEKKSLITKTRKLENELFEKYSFSNIIGSSSAIKKIFSTIKDVAYSSSTILIQGESGTGKELVARAIHYNSPRKDRDLLAFNCSAITGSLIDSELFGHIRGSFTGAVADKKGLFEVADGGTIFLDEIGDMPMESQIRLLRVLEEGEIKAVGSAAPKKINVRVIAATNKDIKNLVAEKKFREDLYYRLGVIVIDLPPLRERREDIPTLAYYFLKKYSDKNAKKVKSISADVLRILEFHKWEGNVRELENVIERGVVVAKGDTILLRDLPSTLLPSDAKIYEKIDDNAPDYNRMSFKDAKNYVVDNFARDYFARILEEANGNISKASQVAKIERSNFKKLLKKYDINIDTFKN